jgi:pimeloyl-ACP methyl ester carboxylesterase
MHQEVRAMPTAKINGLDLYFERHGEQGDPLVLVHGFTGDVSDWRYQVPEFAPDHRLLIFDLRGHGRSEAPRDRAAYTVDQMADDTEALVAEVGFERYHLLGHSMGGAVVQEIALRRPRRLLSLTLEDTSYRFGLGRNEAVRQWAAMRHRLAEEQGMRAVADMPPAGPPPPHQTEERRAEERERLSRMSVDAFIGAWEHALENWPGVRDRLSEIAVPTLVICGELDGTQFVPETGERRLAGLAAAAHVLAEEIPGARLAMIPEAGHAPQYERPEMFNLALREHITAHAAAPVK